MDRKRIDFTFGRMAGAIMAASLAALISPPAHASSSHDVVFPADAGVIDVTDPFFGVIPDDGIDDTAAIQRIFDIITPSSKIVYFPAGQYDISAQITLEKKGFVAEAEDLPFEGWALQTESERTFLVAENAGSGPDDAGRITFEFDAIEANRVMVLTFRTPSEQSNSFFYRVNGGEWRQNSRNVNGNTSWRTSVVTTNIPLVTGANTVEIAARESGFELDNIEIAYLGNYLSDTIIQGQNTEDTVFKLADFATNADGAPFDGAVIRWESGVAQFFRTAVRNLTIDVGQGNPEADGLKFHGNNQSTVSDVRFVAHGNSGDVGLDLAHSSAIGPALFKNISVTGFDIGIHTGWQTASRTFSGVELRDQREFAWVNEAASAVFIEGVQSYNSVPGFRNTSQRLPGAGQGRVVLIDSDFHGLPGAETVDAIVNFGPSMYLRNVSTPGYGRAVFNNNQLSFRGFQGQDGIDGPYVDEWWSHGAGESSAGGMTKLFEDTPDIAAILRTSSPPNIRASRLSEWAGPHQFPILLPSGETSGLPNDDIDDGPSIQAAIDSGATTVYLPNGRWTLDSTIELRGNVRRLIGAEAGIIGSTFEAEPKIIIGETGPRRVVIERLANFGFIGAQPRFEHASRRVVTFNNITGLNYRPTVDRPGKVYINDTVGGSILFKGGQRVYARQLNIEENTTLPDAELDAKIVNDGARVWILGFKTENPGVHVKTINGGVTEILGNLHANQFTDATPQYVTEDARLSVVTNIQPVIDSGSTYGTVVETRDGETRTGTIAGTGYVAFSNNDLWRFRREIFLDNDDAVLTGDWSQSVGFPRGFIGDDFAYARDAADTTAAYNPRIRKTGLHEVYVRWIGDWGGQDHTGHTDAARFTVNHLGGSETFTVDQLAYSDGWYLLGKFAFDKGVSDTPLVTLTGSGDGKVITSDGVRFRWRKN